MSDTFELNSTDIEFIAAKAARFGAAMQWIACNKESTLSVAKDLGEVDDESITTDSHVGAILNSVPKKNRTAFLEKLFSKMVVTESMMWTGSQISGRRDDACLWDSIEENEELIHQAMYSDEVADKAVEYAKNKLKEHLGEETVEKLSDLLQKISAEMCAEERAKNS
jgi:hypothetical protein